MSLKVVSCKACGKEIGKGVKKCVHCGTDQRNFFGKHKILTGVLVIIVLIIVGSIMSSGNKTSTTTSTPNTSAQSKPEETKVEAIKITAKDLSDSYEANEVKADQSYKGKIADITGTIRDVGVVMEQTYVVLSNDKEYSVIGVQCFFKDKTEITKVAELKKGDKVTISGKIEGKSINVEVKDCSIK